MLFSQPAVGSQQEPKNDVYCWAFHGDKDDLVLPSNSIDMINALRAQGRGDDVKFNLLEGVGHNAWDYAYNKELFDWLLSHKRA